MVQLPAAGWTNRTSGPIPEASWDLTSIPAPFAPRSLAEAEPKAWCWTKDSWSWERWCYCQKKGLIDKKNPLCGFQTISENPSFLVFGLDAEQHVLSSSCPPVGNLNERLEKLLWLGNKRFFQVPIPGVSTNRPRMMEGYFYSYRLCVQTGSAPSQGSGRLLIIIIIFTDGFQLDWIWCFLDWDNPPPSPRTSELYFKRWVLKIITLVRSIGGTVVVITFSRSASACRWRNLRIFGWPKNN